MRLRALTLATATGLVLAVAPTTAHAAAKPTFKVTASANKTAADVGQSIKVTGKVAGPRAAKKVLLVQRKVGTSAWKTVAKVRTTTKRKYSASVKVTTAGKQHLRVVAPKSKKAKAGVSRTRAFTGWRWIDLTTAPSENAGDNSRAEVRIAGKAYASKVMTFSGTGIYFNVGRVCSTFAASIGVPDETSDTAELLTFTQKKADFSDEAVPTTTAVAANTAPKAVRQSLTGVSLLGIGAGNGVLTTIAPQARCSVNALAPVPERIEN